MAFVYDDLGVTTTGTVPLVLRDLREMGQCHSKQHTLCRSRWLGPTHEPMQTKNNGGKQAVIATIIIPVYHRLECESLGGQTVPKALCS